MRRPTIPLLVSAGLVAVSAAPVVAQDRVGTLAVSGPGRIVLDAWPTNGWSVKSFENLVEVWFPRPGLSIVAQAALQEGLGPKVSAVEIETDGEDAYLRLTLTCDCPVSVVGNGTDRVEFTIVDPPQVRLSRKSAGPAPEWAPRPTAKPKDVESADTGPLDSDGTLDVDEARARLLEQLMKAAEAGIVEMRPTATEPEPRTDENTSAAPEDAEIADSDGPEPVTPESGPENAQAAVPKPQTRSANPEGDGTKEELAAAEAPEMQPEPDPVASTAQMKEKTYQPEPTCFETAMFTFPDVDEAGSFLEALGDLRGRLVGEFDTPEPAVALDLARTYLSAGMAAEARAVAMGFAPENPESVLLQEIASVLEYEQLPADASLLRDDCGGDQAIWRAVVLAGEPDQADAALTAELVSGRSLERLPLDLREFAAARIGLAAVEQGDWDTARRMEAMAVRAVAGRKSPLGETLLLAARLADWNGDQARAWDLRQRARRSGPPLADTALMEIAETVLKSEKYLGSTTPTLQIELGDLARRERGNEVGAKAFELEARLHARENGRDEVVDLLAEGARTGVLPEDQQAPLLSELIENTKLGELSRPVGLIYLEDPGRFEEAMEQTGFRRAVARSLTELGLPALAEPVMVAEDHADDNLMAGLSEAFLDTGDARKALDVAQLMPAGQSRDGAMGAALAALGQAERSAPLMEALSREDDTARPQLAALEQAVDAGVASGDLSAAQQAAAKLLDLDPTQRRAEELVMLALMTDAPALPADAKTVLDELAPGRSAELAVLFKPTSGAEGLKDHAEASDLLERMETEVNLLEGLLNNG